MVPRLCPAGGISTRWGVITGRELGARVVRSISGRQPHLLEHTRKHRKHQRRSDNRYDPFYLTNALIGYLKNDSGPVIQAGLPLADETRLTIPIDEGAHLGNFDAGQNQRPVRC